MKDSEIKDYLLNNSNSQAQNRIYHWIKKNPDNAKKFSAFKAKHVSLELASTKAYFDNIYPSKKKSTSFLKYGVAASLIILVFSTYLFYSENLENQTITYSTNKNETKTVRLPDNSTIHLNAESSISFSDEFDKNSRELTFTGEAIFDISHNPQKPFTIHTDDLKVRVLGTQFNIRSYPNDNSVETTLISGKVEIIRSFEKSIVLKPEHRATYQKESKNIAVQKVILNDVIGWRDGVFVYENTSLERVIHDLQRFYNKQIIIKDTKLKAFEYTGTFDNLSFEDALNLLLISSPIIYEEKNGSVELKIIK